MTSIATENPSESSATVEYEVLFYKRKNKVHKSKGVSKTDGRLRVNTVTNQICLVEIHDNSSSSNGGSTTTIHSGIHKELATKCRLLSEDETIVLGGNEVQIISQLNGVSSPKNSTSLQMRDNVQKTYKNFSSQQQKALKTTVPVRKVLPFKRKAVPTPVAKPSVAVVSSTKENYETEEANNETEYAGTKDTKTIAVTATLIQHKKLIRRPLLSKSASIGAVGSGTSKKNAVKQTVYKKPPLQSSAHVTCARPVKSTQTLNVAKISQTKGSSTTGGDALLSHIPLPATLAKVFKPHQVTGVHFLWNALHQSPSDECHTPGAILADEMGLGKTLMTVAIIAALHRQERSKQFLVVCPSSLVNNWSNEFDKWLGRAGQPKRVLMQKGGQAGKAQILAFCNSMKQNLSNHLGQVLICSYDLFRLGVDHFAGLSSSFDLLVVDEGHRLKSSSGSQTLTALESIPCDRRLLLTATPVQNNLSEFYTLANFCRPGILGQLSEFRRDFERPIAAANQKDASSRDREFGLSQSRCLEQLTKTFMLRRLQKDVLKSMLPQRIEALLFCQPSQTQRAVYSELAAKANSNLSEALTSLTSLRKVCSHPHLLNDQQNLASNQKNGVFLSGKLLVLDALLQSIREHAPHDKIVVVSNFTSALTIIENHVLKPRELAYCRLDGTTDQASRQSMVDSFNRAKADTKFCFLLSSKAGGCGLNLIGANRLVMFDPDWNPASDKQAMGRVYRTGQSKPTFIYRLFTAGTLEEVIYQRQSQKGNLATLAVDGATASTCGNRKSGLAGPSAHFTKDELKDCFELKGGSLCDTKRKIGSSWSYDGPLSLNCNNDISLINVAQSLSETLGYVHIVNDCDEVACGKSFEEKDFESESTGRYDTEEEDEFEF